METYKKQKIHCQLCLLLFNIVDLKNIKQNYRKFVSIWSWYAMKIPTMLLWKWHLRPRCSSFERSGGNVPLSGVPAHRYQQSLPRYITYQDVWIQQSHAAKRLLS